jgi:hypothetical protein
VTPEWRCARTRNCRPRIDWLSCAVRPVWALAPYADRLCALRVVDVPVDGTILAQCPNEKEATLVTP